MWWVTCGCRGPSNSAPEEDLPDYVFEPDYPLMPVEELRSTWRERNTCPTYRRPRRSKEKGLNLSGFQMRLLEKIEELTLYTVQQEKTIREQQAKNNALEARLTAIEQLLSR